MAPETEDEPSLRRLIIETAPENRLAESCEETSEMMFYEQRLVAVSVSQTGEVSLLARDQSLEHLLKGWRIVQLGGLTTNQAGDGWIGLLLLEKKV